MAVERPIRVASSTLTHCAVKYTALGKPLTCFYHQSISMIW